MINQSFGAARVNFSRTLVSYLNENHLWSAIRFAIASKRIRTVVMDYAERDILDFLKGIAYNLGYNKKK